jgi:hypothetical protein
MNPVHALDFLGAAVKVTRGGSGQTDYAQELTRVDAIVDLRTAALPQMVGRHLEPRLSALPLSVRFDDDGLVRRLRYETTPPESEKPMHRRLEFFDFGAPVERPPSRKTHRSTSLTIAVPPPSVSVGSETVEASATRSDVRRSHFPRIAGATRASVGGMLTGGEKQVRARALRVDRSTTLDRCTPNARFVG